MKFKCCILILLVPFLCHSQSNRIDSLKKLIATSKNSSKIDCLNKLSVEFYVNALSETYINVQTDTAIQFASQAYNEAVKIHYDKGMAEALQNLGEISRDRGEYSQAENYFRQSIPLFEKTNNQEGYNWAHVTLGFSLDCQCKFAEAKLAYEKAMPYYVKVKNRERQSMIFRLISLTYSARGFNEKAFENTLQAIRITEKISDARGVISSPENIANLYRNAGEPEIALTYFRLAAQKSRQSNPVRYNRLMGNISLLLDQLDSAIYYNKESHRYVTIATNDSSIIKRSLSYRNVSIGEIYVMQNRYDLAIEEFKDPLQFFKQSNNRTSVMRISLALAKCYNAKQNFNSSFLYAKQLFDIAEETGSRPFLRDAYKLFWQHYNRQHNIDSAYKYNLKYIAIKDSILSDEYRRNIALSEMRSQDEQQKTTISLLQKSQQLNQEMLLLQQEKLKSETFLRYILIASTIAFVLVGVIIFRNINLNRKNEKLHLQHELELQQLESKKNIIELQQQATELEMQALRAQMNPHFIFNCLSSINRFILINKTDEASDYLTKFSRLIRMALHNSEKSLITLENELEALRLYLDLEMLRFRNAFNYKITVVNAIDVSTIYIPPMLIQPFAENAIWHGLMHKKAVGSLEIKLCAEVKILTCSIEDDGIGRNMASTLKTRSAEKNKSMGVEITAGRLVLLNRSAHGTAALKIEDLIDEDGKACGTKVILKIPFKDLSEINV